MNQTITRFCIVSLLLIIATTLAYTFGSESRSDYDAVMTTDGAEASAYANLYEGKKWGIPGTESEAWASITSPVGASWYAEAGAACGDYVKDDNASDGPVDVWIISDGFCPFFSPNRCGAFGHARVGTNFGPDPAMTAFVRLSRID